MKKLFYLLIALFLLAVPSTATAEQITSFDVIIDIQTDGQIQVTEKILYDFQKLSRHGIYRDIPLSSKVANKYRHLQFTISQILRDSEPETHSVSQKGDIFFIRIGHPDKTINHEHLYQIKYQVQNALGNFTTHDELY